MTNTPTSVFFVLFRNGELMLEYTLATDQWELPQRLVKKIPDGRYVEIIFGEVLREIDVHEVVALEVSGSSAQEVFHDLPLYVCVVSGHTMARKTEIVNFWTKESLLTKKDLSHRVKTALTIPQILDRLL